MAGSVNKVILVGTVVADPEVKRTQDGRPIANLRVATNETWKDKQGERKERSEYHRVVIFNEGICKVAEQYLRKGSKVYIEGQLQARKWQDQSGADRYSTEVVIQAYGGSLVMLDSPDSGGTSQRQPVASGNAYAAARGGGYQKAEQNSYGDAVYDESEIPF